MRSMVIAAVEVILLLPRVTGLIHAAPGYALLAKV